MKPVSLKAEPLDDPCNTLAEWELEILEQLEIKEEPSQIYPRNTLAEWELEILEQLEIKEEPSQIYIECNVCSKIITNQDETCDHFGSKGKKEEVKLTKRKQYRKKKPPIGEKPLHCKFCPKKFPLLYHHSIHTGDKRYKCQFCQKSFVQKSQLNWHLKMHTGGKPHVCVFCDKGFSQKAMLYTHLRSEIGEKPHECRYYFRGFADTSARKRHEQNHTG